MAVSRVASLVIAVIILVAHACSGNERGIRQIEHNETLVTSNTTNYDNVTVIWPNGTRGRVNLTATVLLDSPVVDCFGLGPIVAKILTWWFTQKANLENTLDVKFFLSSRKKRGRVEVIAGDQFGLEWTDFVVERKTIFIVHGFLSDGREAWIRDMEDALLAMEDVNVVVVDWAAHGNIFNYYKAVVNTEMVGKEIARFLHHIVNATIDANPSDKPRPGTLHLVGHSLGAHICGVAAYNFKRRQSSWMVHRITGLDPAQPCYRNMNLSMQLDSTDAPFVDVIHTNGRLLTSLGLGQPEPIGHVDFYPNGGKSQPGCIRSKPSYVDYIPVPKSVIQQAICSHGRSYIYFTESINAAVAKNCTFWAHQWDRSYRHAVRIMSETCVSGNCTEMGIRARDHLQRGAFLAITSKSTPFCETNERDREEVKNQLKEDYKHEIDD